MKNFSCSNCGYIIHECEEDIVWCECSDFNGWTRVYCDQKCADEAILINGDETSCIHCRKQIESLTILLKNVDVNTYSDKVRNEFVLHVIDKFHVKQKGS
ncbi:MAG: hypothetical protein ACRCW9_03940 [Cetobacterium sp.]